MPTAIELAKPALPASSCHRHEQERIDAHFVRRVGGLPCPGCWAEDPKRGKVFVKTKKSPQVEVGKGGFGLKIAMQIDQRVEYELCTLSQTSRQLVWRIKSMAG